MRKILHVHRHRLVLRCLEAGVEAQVTDDEIHAAVPGEVSSDDAVPPAVALLESRHVHLHQPAVALVVENGDRHPLADDDEIGPAITVDVLPECVRHHADVREAGRCLVGDVGEVPATIVLEQHALRIESITPGNAASTDEQIDCTIAVKISRRHAGSADRQRWQRAIRFPEISLAVVQVESVVEQWASL